MAMQDGNMLTVHNILDRNDWDINELESILRMDTSSINADNEEGRTPLLKVLEHENCTVGFVQMLLAYGADVNLRAECGRYPMSSALVYSREEPIIRAMLELGADPNAQFYNRSALCIAFECTSIDVVKLFLKTDCALNACRMHTSLLHCALNYTKSKSSMEILKLLIETGVDVHRVDRQGQPILCFALEGGARDCHIQLLLNAGALLTACSKHTTPFHCATNNTFATPFREGVVKLLLNKGVCPYTLNDDGESPLQRALRYNNCETGAIKLLLDLPGMDIIVNEQNLLHYAIGNDNCTLSILDLLIKKGARLDIFDKEGDTPLHLATRNSRASVVNLLLQRNAPVNANSRANLTPLMEAVKWERDSNILMLLFIAGASIGRNPFQSLQITYDTYEKERCRETLDCFNMLTKMSLLENPDIDINVWIQSDIAAEPFLSYACACVSELRKMDQNHGSSLRQFLRGNPLRVDNQPEVPAYDLTELLKIRPDTAFPKFYDIIASRVGKRAIVQKMIDIRVYTVVTACPCRYSEEYPYDRCPSVAKKVALNYESVCEIFKKLSPVDALNTALAFFKPPKCSDNSQASGYD